MLTQYHIHNFHLEFRGNHKETQIFNGKVEKLLELIVIYYFCYVHPFWYGNTIFSSHPLLLCFFHFHSLEFIVYIFFGSQSLLIIYCCYYYCSLTQSRQLLKGANALVHQIEFPILCLARLIQHLLCFGHFRLYWQTRLTHVDVFVFAGGRERVNRIKQITLSLSLSVFCLHYSRAHTLTYT